MGCQCSEQLVSPAGSQSRIGLFTSAYGPPKHHGCFSFPTMWMETHWIAGERRGSRLSRFTLSSSLEPGRLPHTSVDNRAPQLDGGL